MDFANCAKCGKAFSRINSPICEDCQREEEIMFRRVKDYVDENRDKTVSEVSEATEASVNKIMKYLREGRLQVSRGMSAEKPLRCQQCGKPIIVGLYCDSCTIAINQTINGFKEERRRGTGMHSMQPNQASSKKSK